MLITRVAAIAGALAHSSSCNNKGCATARMHVVSRPQHAGVRQLSNTSVSSRRPLVARYAQSSSELPEASNSITAVEGNIHSTESFSAVDGPGIRFIVFTQGCGMRCLFCSNPDTQAIGQGARISSKDIAGKLQRLLPYLQPNDGGVTCSGGEPMLQPEFVAAVFQEAHALGLTTCLDTTGQGTKHHNWDAVLPHTDMVLFCIKHLDPLQYEHITGLHQHSSLAFVHELNERGIPFWLRYVLIPGLTDRPGDIEMLVEFCKQQTTMLGVELLPYHMLGKNKWDALGWKYPLEDVKLPTREHVQEVVQQLQDCGVNVLCDVKGCVPDGHNVPHGHDLPLGGSTATRYNVIGSSSSN